MSQTTTGQARAILDRSDWAIQSETALYGPTGRPLDIAVSCLVAPAGYQANRELERLRDLWFASAPLVRPALSALTLVTGLNHRDVANPRTVSMELEGSMHPMGIASMRSLCRELASIAGPSRAEDISGALQAFPVPVFGSAPKGFQQLAGLGASGAYVAAFGTWIATGHPGIAFFTAASAGFIYLAKPTAAVVRENLAARVERALRLPPDPDANPGPTQVQDGAIPKELPPSTFY